MDKFFKESTKKTKLLVLLSTLGILIILSIAILVPFKDKLLSNLYPKPKSEAFVTNIDSLTSQLIQKKDEYNKLTKPGGVSSQAQKELDNLTNLAIKRQGELSKLIEKDPQTFLNAAKLADQKDSFPKQVKPYIEQKVEIKGKLLKIHYDSVDQQKSETKYFLSQESDLKNGSSGRVMLFLLNNSSLTSGDQIQVTGIELDRKVAAKSATVISKAATTQPATLTEARVAVILFKFNNTPDEPITKSQAADLVFSGDQAVKRFYEESSYNTMRFNGGSSDVFGWYDISYNNNHPCVYDNQWLEELNRKVQDSGVTLSNYTHKVYVFTRNTQCSGYAGWAHIGGDTAMINGQFSASIIAHELGHNFGLDHASSLYCREQTLDIYSNCLVSEYGDPYDVMGKGYRHFNSPHKFLLGWLAPTDIQAITADGRYTVGALEYTGTESRALKVRKNNTNEYYYIEYRQPFGFDSTPLGNEGDGVQIRIWDEAAPNDRSTNFPRILDNHPFTEGIFKDSSLADGETFYDYFNKISIKQISHTTTANSASATVEVSFNPQMSPTPTPLVSNPIGSWQRATDLPKPLMWHAAATSAGYIFLLGGARYTTTETTTHLDTVYSGKVNTDGEIESWRELNTTPLPKALNNGSAIALNGYLYLLGGVDSTYNSLSSIYKAKINSDGTLSAWTELSQTPLPKGLQYFSSVAYGGIIYVIAGYSQSNYNGTYEDKVYSAKVNSDGTLQPWNTQPDFPARVMKTAAVVDNGYLMVVGGGDYNGNTDGVYSAQILSNGDLGSWIQFKTKKYPQQRSGMRGVSQKGAIIMIGGEQRSWSGNTAAVSDVYSSRILSNGRIDPWFTATPLPEPRYNHAAVITNNGVYVIGGYDSNLTKSTVYYSPLAEDLTLPVNTPAPTPSSSSQSISFSSGYNFVGITLNKTGIGGTGRYSVDNFITDLNSSSAGNVTQVSRWNAGSWQSYIKDSRGTFGENFDISLGKGYLVKATRYANTTLTGTQAFLSSLTINPGWNSISFVSVPDDINTAEKLVNKMRDQGITISTLSRWKDGSWKSYIPGFPAGSFNILPGEGYFLKSSITTNKTFNISSYTTSLSTQIIKPVSSPAPPLCNSCSADINKDKRVNISDFSSWSACRIRGINTPRCSSADIDKDNQITSKDFECIRSNYGKRC